jgi:hypothetical protein
MLGTAGELVSGYKTWSCHCEMSSAAAREGIEEALDGVCAQEEGSARGEQVTHVKHLSQYQEQDNSIAGLGSIVTQIPQLIFSFVCMKG